MKIENIFESFFTWLFKTKYGNSFARRLMPVTNEVSYLIIIFQWLLVFIYFPLAYVSQWIPLVIITIFIYVEFLSWKAALNTFKKQIDKGISFGAPCVLEIKLAKKQWLRGTQLSGSLSPRDKTALFNLPDDVPEGTIIPPFLNFGIGLSVGDWFTQKHNVRIKQQEKEIYDFELNQEKLGVRRQVLVAYQKYLISIEVLKARQKALHMINRLMPLD